ncbi:hypothetical protein ARALYDRAFT_896135 [Arabidopsis lyrata subsp. lyrata]|uniref:Aldose 1-epimerase n=1 Tax=Arabidopsis lyrata subsp. lyrata TaxID=81972 RepID=D7LAH4_ARALL|nr:hypothetical protein ARALYDRAFT_896135 [Arabidopsis lyrata subsp. lyrata]
MVRISSLVCLVLLVTIGVMVSVSLADNNEEKSTDLKKVKGGVTDRSISKKTLGVHELKKGNLTAKFTNRGASIMSLLFPNKNGKIEDIVLGYDSVNDYMNDTVFCGVTLARVANKREKTVVNDGKHGVTKESGDVIWTVKKHNNNGKKPYIVFRYTSPDGDHQGKLEVTVTYKLVGDNKLKMVMEAKAKEKATPVNLVHRSYWNLGGHNNEDILSEEIQILGSGYAHLDHNLTPTGKILAVKGTPYDFRQLRPIKDNINELKTGKVVELVDKKSKIKMELSTDQSGLKFYTGGRLKKNKNGSVHKAYSGLCLESHAINNQYRPSQIVEPGKNYKHTMLFKFSIVPSTL